MKRFTKVAVLVLSLALFAQVGTALAAKKDNGTKSSPTFVLEDSNVVANDGVIVIGGGW